MMDRRVRREVEFRFSPQELSMAWDLNLSRLIVFTSEDRSVVLELGYDQVEMILNDNCIFSVGAPTRGVHKYHIQDLIDMINAATLVHQIHIKVTELE